MSEYLKANEILQKVKKTQHDFDFRSKLQVIDQITKRTQNGRPYLVITLRDISNEIPNVKKWTRNEEEYIQDLKTFEVGNILELNATYNRKYNSAEIAYARKLDSNEFNVEDFVKFPEINVKILIENLYNIISKIQNNKLKHLLEMIFADEEIKKKYIECPSSIIKHHAYKYGNLEHTVGMIKLFEQLVKYYNRNTNLDVDLIYAGIILHDIGKIYEIQLYNGLPKGNSKGILYGHLVCGDHLVSKFIKEIDGFPKDIENKLRHLILSHHGKKEWDSVVEPQFPEAEMLHYLDMIDSRFKLNY